MSKSISVKAGGNIEMSADEVGRDKIVNEPEEPKLHEENKEDSSIPNLIPALPSIYTFAMSMWAIIKRWLSI